MCTSAWPFPIVWDVPDETRIDLLQLLYTLWKRSHHERLSVGYRSLNTFYQTEQPCTQWNVTLVENEKLELMVNNCCEKDREGYHRQLWMRETFWQKIVVCRRRRWVSILECWEFRPNWREKRRVWIFPVFIFSLFIGDSLATKLDKMAGFITKMATLYNSFILVERLFWMRDDQVQDRNACLFHKMCDGCLYVRRVRKLCESVTRRPWQNS